MTFIYTRFIQIHLIDIKGNRVWNQTGKFTVGTHFIKWDGKNKLGNNVPSGTYVVEASNGALIKTRKMLLLK
jgi:flagellar hook assembly protein FlgD